MIPEFVFVHGDKELQMARSRPRPPACGTRQINYTANGPPHSRQLELSCVPCAVTSWYAAPISWILADGVNGSSVDPAFLETSKVGSLGATCDKMGIIRHFM